MEEKSKGTILSRLLDIKKSNFGLKAKTAIDNIGSVAVLKKITNNINRLASMVSIEL
ncbi:MAG: hypothetical protein IPF54_00805 [Draconibacterium sp.]|nr:hypothetical protein [Draconibacterium sp.]